MTRHVILSVAGLALSSLFTISPVVAAPQAEASPVRSLSVDGVASSRLTPDRALVTFGVVVRDPTATEAVSANARSQEKLAAAIAALGIEGADIRSDRYVMSYVVDTFTPALGTTQPVEFKVEQRGAYQVVSHVVVSLGNLGRLSELIQTAVSAGADGVDAVQYSSSRLAGAQAALVGKAIEDARAKAQAAASAIGVPLGDLQSVRIETPNAGQGTDTVPASADRAVLPMIDISVIVHATFAIKGSG